MNLKFYRDAYDNGEPLIPDSVYDALVSIYGEPGGIGNADGDVAHLYRLYSLQKIFDDETIPTACDRDDLVKSPKLDGFAVSLLYEKGNLVRGLTRGDGILGRDITDKVMLLDSIPKQIEFCGGIQIVGEVLFTGNVDNQRNMASGSFGLNDLNEFKLRIKDLHFVCYSNSDIGKNTYIEDMEMCKAFGFETVYNLDSSKYITDGVVYRVNNNRYFYSQGYTSKHPRAAYAHKYRKDVEIKETKLKDVIWQTGATGKVTPVAIVEETVIDGAKINRLTIHNVGYVEKLDLDIGDTILISRSGGVIPKILGNVSKEIFLYDN